MHSRWTTVRCRGQVLAPPSRALRFKPFPNFEELNSLPSRTIDDPTEISSEKNDDGHTLWELELPSAVCAPVRSRYGEVRPAILGVIPGLQPFITALFRQTPQSVTVVESGRARSSCLAFVPYTASSPLGMNDVL